MTYLSIVVDTVICVFHVKEWMLCFQKRSFLKAYINKYKWYEINLPIKLKMIKEGIA